MIRRALGAVALRGGGVALQLGVNLLLGRLLGASGMGVYGFYTAATHTLGEVLGLGLPNRVMQAVAQARAADRPEQARGAVRAALRLGLAVTALGAAAIGLGASLLSGMGSERFASFVVAGALAAVGALGFLVLRVIADALKGWGRVTVALALESYGVPVGVLAGVALGLILVGAEAIGPHAAVGWHLAALVGTAALLAWVWRRVSRGSGGVAIRLRDRRLARFWGLAVLGVVTTNLPVVVAPLFAEAAGVGQFTVAFRLVGLVTMVLMTLAAWFGPRFAAAAGDPKRLRRDLLTSQGLSLAVAAPAFGVFLAVPGEVMAVFGSDFRAGAGLLTILIVGQIVNAGTGLAGYLLQMAGHERTEFRINLVAAGTALGLFGILGSAFGIHGIALAVTASVCIKKGASWVMAWSVTRPMAGSGGN
jgi:O-antigen/teichoic acid export membrane protein